MHYATSPEPHDESPSRDRSRKARAMALRLLAFRPRTVSEMTDRLASKFGDREAEEAVQKLQAEGLLDDDAFARQWRESRERRSPRSRRMMERELQQRGVSNEVIEAAMEGFDQENAAHRAAARYASRQAGSDRVAFDRRVGAYLHRRGFHAEVIRQTLRQLREELAVGDNGE